MHYFTPEGRAILDATAGLWCCNAGHNRAPIVAAIQRQAAELDFTPTFQFAHPLAFQLASRHGRTRAGRSRSCVLLQFRLGSGRHALKIALAYHNVRGPGLAQRLIGRERGYHGVGFGGISVGGMVNNRKFFGSLLAGVDHLPTTYNREHQAFTKGEPEWGGHLADALEGIVAPARRLDHRRGDRRADGGLDRRSAGAQGLSASACARSATNTASCSSSTRSSPASAASARRSPPSATASCPT